MEKGGGGAEIKKLWEKEKIEDFKVVENLNLRIIINSRIPDSQTVHYQPKVFMSR